VSSITSIGNLHPWEVETFFPADGPEWLVEARARWEEALDEYHATISGVVAVNEQAAAAARAHRRAVRRAISVRCLA
jgi:hypothetical protein